MYFNIIMSILWLVIGASWMFMSQEYGAGTACLVLAKLSLMSNELDQLKRRR